MKGEMSLSLKLGGIQNIQVQINRVTAVSKYEQVET